MPGLFTETGMDHEAQVLESIIIVVVVVVVSCHESFPPCTSLEPSVIPTAQTAVFPYYVSYSKYSCLL
jgi:hypothetical protein